MADDHESEFTQTPLGAASGVIHELFLSYVGAGFTEDQALRLIGYTLAAAGRNGEEYTDNE